MNIFSLVFGADKENLADKFSRKHSFELRPQQIAMLSAVTKAIYENKNLIVEAGTGVGKSIAYLLPFIKWTVEKEKKAIISTYTKTLQEQLTKKDLPHLKNILGIDFNFALCLGAANYLCLRRLHQNADLDIFSADKEKNDTKKLWEWSDNTQTGLRTELNFAPAQTVWEKICRESDLCLGKKCIFRQKCFYYKAKAKEHKAHILVTDHHLFFANIASSGAVLPAFDAVVFDEAHTLEQVATTYLGIEISNFQIKYLFDSLFNSQTGKGLLWGIKGVSHRKIEEIRIKLETVRLAAQDFFSKLLTEFSQEAQTTRIRKALLHDHFLLSCFSDISESLKGLLQSAKRDEDKLDIQHFTSCIDGLKRNLGGILNMQWPGYVYWFNLQARQRGLRLSLCSAPIDISQEFKEKVLIDKQPLVFTSATISVNGKFDFIKENLGFAPDVDSIILDSPFDYNKNVLLYIARSIPDPNGPQKEYLDALFAEIKEILKLTNGRTFILFTSFKIMNKAHENLKNSFTNLRFLKHGEAPRYRLLETFKNGDNNVLLGTNTFWQGIDIPGRSLECVVITKLPFAVPDDPITEARMEMLEAQGNNPFTHYQLPQAVTMLRQGFGRLIRTKSDRGMVAILDSRIATRHYGKDFLQAIPSCKRIYHLTEVRSFFAANANAPCFNAGI